MHTTQKKILYVITKSNFGGAQRYVYELATSLPKDEFDVGVAFGGNGLLKEKLESAGIKTYQVKSFERNISFSKEIKSMFELGRIIRTLQPDVVHLNSSKAGGTGALIARLLGVRRIVFTAHGWPFLEKRSLLWRSVVWFLSYVTTILVHNVILVSKHDFRKTVMPFVQRKCSVIHTAVPPINFLPRDTARATLFSSDEQSLHAHDIWLVTVAELTPNKNIRSALEAVRVHNAKSAIKIFYTIMGEGELKAELELFIKNKNLSPYVKLVGYIQEGRALLKAFDIFLLPSLKEGLPYALLEAGAAGLPAIGSEVGGIPEIIENRVSGMLINPRDPKTIVAALLELNNNELRRHSLGYTLQEYIGHEFALSEMVEKTKRLYQ